MKTLGKIDKPIMLKKNKTQNEEKKVTRKPNIISIHCPSTDVSFSLIKFGF